MRAQIRASLASLVCLVSFASVALACLWDSDTLQMERLRFPGVLEIITGKFVRHSKAYYEWRIKDRLKKLERAPDDPALIDDLAVGYDKLGRYDEGIAILEKSLAAQPDRYETLANLATLLFHAGRLEESKQHVERALEINPDAHFGREKYQLLLTEYVQQSDLETEGVMSSQTRHYEEICGFATYVIEARFGTVEQRRQADMPWQEAVKQQNDEIRSAMRGVLGMLHFADFQSPLLLEALGDLLMAGDRKDNATQLAARAYLRAAQQSNDTAIAEKYRAMARSALQMHEDFGMHHKESDGDLLIKLEKELNQELASGKTWFASIEGNENRWIAEERDVDREFAAIYYSSLDSTITDAEQQVNSEPTDYRRTVQDRILINAVGTFCVLPLSIAVAVTVTVLYWVRRRRPVSPSLREPIEKAF